ncbi:hypothetical protein Ocin01_14659 [Orchesella cincta]|uniref:F-box domain-containing protein n=1 Tax=Orchesella cincta TaxID=48709 RepID=A0A1D2MGA5_ORCCI|nr:hypothetical protein Ocin01_14659 [Orchesella cincta]
MNRTETKGKTVGFQVQSISEVAMDHIEIMPEEVWKDIFDLLNNSDKISCLKAHAKWRKWLKSKRTLLLFPEVLQLIRDRLEREELLGLRCVCKKWKDDVDNAPAPFYQFRTMGFKTLASVERFLDDMKYHTGNPFPERCVTLNQIEYPNGHEDFWDQLQLLRIDFWAKVEEFLDKFGQQIWSLCLTAGDIDYVAPSVEECVRNCFFRVPQLKRLTLSSHYIGDGLERDIVGNSSRIIDFYMSNPLPRLIHLEEIDINSLVPNAVVKAILEGCCVPKTMKRVTLENGFYDAFYAFSNLEVLEAHVSFEDLERFRNVHPPLRKIKLNVHSRAKVDAIDFENLFSILHQFDGTLTEVDIKGTPILRMEAVNNFRIQLPRLESLYLRDYDGPFDPILGLKKLRHFVVENEELISRPMQGSVVEFEGFEERIKESNIWTLLPSLTWLQFQITNCNGHFRHHFEMLRKSNP